MTAAPFRLEVESGIGLLTLSRSERLNALTFEMYRSLVELFTGLASDARVQAVVLTGEGRGFCSGGDVEAIIGELVSRSIPELLEFTRLTCALVKAIRSLRKPVLAAINGVAAGAGAAIALACDLRVASPSAKIAFLFTKVGLSGADMGVGFLLPKVIGLGRATELLYFGDAVDAETAERYGLFNRVVPDDALLPEAMAWARRLASGPTFALGVTKELVNGHLGADLFSALDDESRAQALCLHTEDFREAHRAWTEKRPPKFQGR